MSGRIASQGELRILVRMFEGCVCYDATTKCSAKLVNDESGDPLPEGHCFAVQQTNAELMSAESNTAHISVRMSLIWEAVSARVLLE